MRNGLQDELKSSELVRYVHGNNVSEINKRRQHLNCSYRLPLMVAPEQKTQDCILLVISFIPSMHYVTGVAKL